MGSLWSQKLRKLTNSPRTKETWRSRAGEADTRLPLSLERLSPPTVQYHLSLNRTWKPAPPSRSAKRTGCCVEREAAETTWGMTRAQQTPQLNSHPEITFFWGLAARWLPGPTQVDRLMSTNARAGAAIADLRVQWPYEGPAKMCTNSEENAQSVASLSQASSSLREGKNLPFLICSPH